MQLCPPSYILLPLFLEFLVNFGEKSTCVSVAEYGHAAGRDVIVEDGGGVGARGRYRGRRDDWRILLGNKFQRDLGRKWYERSEQAMKETMDR